MQTSKVHAADHAVPVSASSGAVNAFTTLQTSLLGSIPSFPRHKHHLVPRQPSPTASVPVPSLHAHNETVDELQDFAAFFRQRFQEVVKQNSTHFYNSNITDEEPIDQVEDEFQSRFALPDNDLKNLLLPGTCICLPISGLQYGEAKKKTTFACRDPLLNPS